MGVSLIQVNDKEKRAVLGDLLYEIRFPTMTQEESVQKVAACSILSDTEIKHIFMLFSEVKPPKTLLFKSKKRTANFQLLEFPANSVSTKINLRGIPNCTVVSNRHIPAEFEISEVQFCQPVGHETINQVDIDGVIANSVEKVQNKTFKGYPVYKASFEKATLKYSSQDNGQASITFKNKNVHKYYRSNEQTAMITAGTINHSFAVNGRQITLALEGYNKTTWCCLTALKVRCVKPKATTINDLGVGPEEIEKKKISGGPCPRKNKFQKAFSRKK